jgi:hypothetical protein
MAARLGYVLYWLGCLVSIVVFVALMLMVSGRPRWPDEYAFLAVVTVAPWVVGRALRYILAGD